MNDKRKGLVSAAPARLNVRCHRRGGSRLADRNTAMTGLMNPARGGADPTPWPHPLQNFCSISSEPSW
jgi:hypothetical protein